MVILNIKSACPECKSSNLRQESDSEFICNDCGCVFNPKKINSINKNFKNEVATSLLVQLYPLNEEEKENWTFENIRRILLSLPRIKQDSTNKPLDSLDDECYYLLEAENSKIFFEINGGYSKNISKKPRLSIRFENIRNYIRLLPILSDIIKEIEIKNPLFKFKIYSDFHGGFVDLSQLKKPKNKNEP